MAREQDENEGSRSGISVLGEKTAVRLGIVVGVFVILVPVVMGYTKLTDNVAQIDKANTEMRTQINTTLSTLTSQNLEVSKQIAVLEGLMKASSAQDCTQQTAIAEMKIKIEKMEATAMDRETRIRVMEEKMRTATMLKP